MKRANSPLPPEPWKPIEWQPEDAYALRALQAGTATEGQQKRALAWIIAAARTYDQPYRSDSPHDTSFACGMMWVGQQVIKLLNAKIEILDKQKGKK